jgi:acetoin utilization deacetylase AcuC-like enzyme
VRVADWLRRWTGPAARHPLVYHPAYETELAVAEHDHRRGARILAFLSSEGLAPARIVHTPQAAPLAVLRRVHTDAYLEAVEDPKGLLPILGFTPTTAQRDAYVDVQRIAVGGTLLATRLAVSRPTVAVHLGGGLHHAFSDHGQGFCVFNDVAIAISEERSGGFGEPVLVIDLDLHDGDGTRAVFADDPTVHTFSIHNHDLGSTEAEGSTSVALGDGVEDGTYLRAVQAHLPPVLDGVRPGLVLFLAGTDPAADDRLGNWRITPRGMLERDRFVLSQVRERDPRPALVVLLAGGYGRSSWSYSARFLSWILTGGEVLEPPSTEELTLESYRRLARRLRPQELVRGSSDDWELGDEDVLGSLTGHQRSGRWLGYYSRDGIELALERYGFLDQLRARGFERLSIDCDFDDESGQTLRIFAGPGRKGPLLELRVRRDATTAPGFELVRVEWLMLQDPRRSFRGDHEQLPGQKHPGLGLLRDVIALLVMLCERLGLDGIVFLPSHYHLAVQSQRHLRFLEPSDEARFRAMRDALGDLALSRATHVVHEARLVDTRTGGPARWVPAPRVLPVSDRLKQRVGNRDYEERVASLMSDFSFRVTS